jgi:DNA polymerase III epsilon subunit-like protein
MIVLDIETTGRNPYKHCILSIGALDFDAAENQFYGECHIDSDAEIDPESLSINGFSVNEAKDPEKKNLKELLEDFLKWTLSCKNLVIAGESPGYDRAFLLAACEKHDLKYPFGFRTIDLHTLAYAELFKKGIKFNSDKLVSELSLNKTSELLALPKQPEPHNAMSDAKIAAEAFSRILFKKNLLEEFRNYPLKEFGSSKI